MIIGVALVVGDTTKGQRLLFRYPEAVPSSLQQLGNEGVRFHEEYLSLGPDSFAKLFKPKHSMLNMLLDIVVDDIQYISYPMACQRDDKQSSVDENGIDINMFNVVIATVRDSTMQRLRPVDLADARSRHGGRVISGEDPIAVIMGLANINIGISVPTLRRYHFTITAILVFFDKVRMGRVVERFSRALLHQERQEGYVSKEAVVMMQAWDKSRASAATRPTHRTFNPASDILSQGGGLSDGCVPDASDAISALPGKANISPLTPSPTGGDGSGGSPKNRGGCSGDEFFGEGGIEKYIRSKCNDFILQRSTLANEIRSLYHCLVGGFCVCLTINSKLSLNIPLHDMSLRSLPAHCSSIGEKRERYPRPLACTSPAEPRHKKSWKQGEPAPYQTFLPIADLDTLEVVMELLGCSGGPSAGMRESIVTPSLSGSVSEDNIAITKSLKARALASGIWSPGEEEGNKTNSKHRAMPLLRATPSLLNSDPLVHHCSPKMWKIISSANPLMSFAELRQTLGLTSGEVNSSVMHLCEWGLGEIINTITANSLYQIHPDCPLSNETTADSKRRAAGARLAEAFSSAFGGGDINSVLATFNGDSSLTEAISNFPKNLNSHGVDIVVWLLRRHVLIELQYYLVDLMVCSAKGGSSPASASAGIAMGMKPLSHHHQPTYMRTSSDGNIGNGTMFGSRYARGTMRGGDGFDINSDRVIRQKLMPYLDGRTPMCDILWLEDLTEEVVLATVRNTPNIIINVRPLQLVQGY